jgi:hypothetical protein
VQVGAGRKRLAEVDASMDGPAGLALRQYNRMPPGDPSVIAARSLETASNLLAFPTQYTELNDTDEPVELVAIHFPGPRSNLVSPGSSLSPASRFSSSPH